MLCGCISIWGDRYSQNKIRFCRDQVGILLDMPGMGGDTQVRNAQEMFRDDVRNLQRVVILLPPLRQNTLCRPAQGSGPVAA